MIKKISLGILIFLGSTFVFTVLFFPYGKVIEFYADKAAKEADINLSIGKSEAGIFSAELTNVKIDSFNANKITIKYSPLSIFTKKASVKMESDVLTGEVFFKGADVTAKGLVNLNNIPNTQIEGLSGELLINLAYAGTSGKGTISSSKLTIPSDLGPLPLTDVNGDFVIEKNIIGIMNLKSDGVTKIDLKGNIRINTVNFDKSTIMIAGTVNAAGLEKNLAITGEASGPKITLN